MKAWFVIFTVSAIVCFGASIIAGSVFHSVEWGSILAFCSGFDAMAAIREYQKMRNRA